ncbi:MAG: class I tRNA ligase family protein, partial [Clostridia bacterium]
KELCSPELQRKWLPVDLYIGGAEHAVLHLLYARFWHKVLYDIGVVDSKEPFHKLVNQGMILGENNEKMSKSRGNVVNPDDIVNQYGADTLRIYEMFMGPLESAKPWSDNGVEGSHRFLTRVWRMFFPEEGVLNPKIQDTEGSDSFKRVLHKVIKAVSTDLENLRFNTAISQLMVFLNEANKETVLPKKAMEQFILLLAPLAPHIAEELWEKMGHNNTLSYEKWPEYEEAFTIDNEVEIAVQVNGKIKDRLVVPTGADQESLKEQALALETVREAIEGREIKKCIVVPNRLVNIVIG